MLFVSSKVFWHLVEPDLLLLGLVLIGLVLATTRRWARAGIRIAATGALLLLAVAFLPADAWLIAPLENRFPEPRSLPGHVDGIIVLGGALDPERSAAHGIPSLNAEAERMTTFVKLARAYPTAKLVFTGGSASIFGDRSREADSAKILFADLGLDTSRIIFERNSRNTYENAISGKVLAAPKSGDTWILVSSAFHMPRAVGIFRQAGWPVVAWPVAFKTGHGYDPSLAGHLVNVDLALHEWAGLVAYRLLRRTDALFPSP